MPEVADLIARCASGNSKPVELKRRSALILAGDHEVEASPVERLVKLDYPPLITAADVLPDQSNRERADGRESTDGQLFVPSRRVGVDVSCPTHRHLLEQAPVEDLQELALKRCPLCDDPREVRRREFIRGEVLNLWHIFERRAAHRHSKMDGIGVGGIIRSAVGVEGHSRTC